MDPTQRPAGYLDLRRIVRVAKMNLTVDGRLTNNIQQTLSTLSRYLGQQGLERSKPGVHVQHGEGFVFPIHS